MVLSISRHDTLIIEDCDMRMAVGFISQVLKSLEFVFRGTGDSDMALATSRVQNYIEKVGMSSRKELLNHLHRHMGHETLDRIIYVLTEIGWCTPQMVGTTCYYKHNNGTNPLNMNGKRKP
jgi:hypothetical protein